MNEPRSDPLMGHPSTVPVDLESWEEWFNWGAGWKLLDPLMFP